MKEVYILLHSLKQLNSSFNFFAIYISCLYCRDNADWKQNITNCLQREGKKQIRFGLSCDCNI